MDVGLYVSIWYRSLYECLKICLFFLQSHSFSSLEAKLYWIFLAWDIAPIQLNNGIVWFKLFNSSAWFSSAHYFDSIGYFLSFIFAKYERINSVWVYFKQLFKYELVFAVADQTPNEIEKRNLIVLFLTAIMRTNAFENFELLFKRQFDQKSRFYTMRWQDYGNWC